jgi:Zn-dependent peptidase ImmA (M78 family)/transcriptional regulator with XRE-family HTH domain
MTIACARASAALFDPLRLRLARHYNGMRKVDLAKHVGLTPSAVTQLENGLSKPTAAHLTQLALALGFPVDFFAKDGRREDVSDQGRAFFRSLRSTRQIDRDRAEAQAFFVREIVGEVERRVRLPAVDIPSNLHIPQGASRDDIERCAEQLRALWTVPGGPIASVVRLLEAHGTIVTHCTIECRQVSSFSRWFNGRPVVVLSAARSDLPRLRSDAAHELGHLVLHAEVDPGNQILETQAQAFAASFLLPQREIAALLPKSFDIERYGKLKHTWGVSIQALLYRARELNRMSEATYRRAMMLLSQKGWRTNEPFPISGHEDVSILPRSLELLRQHGYDAATLARDTYLPLDFVSQIVASPADDRPELVLS